VLVCMPAPAHLRVCISSAGPAVGGVHHMVHKLAPHLQQQAVRSELCVKHTLDRSSRGLGIPHLRKLRAAKLPYCCVGLWAAAGICAGLLPPKEGPQEPHRNDQQPTGSSAGQRFERRGVQLLLCSGDRAVVLHPKRGEADTKEFRMDCKFGLLLCRALSLAFSSH
jgi:hypothetical protein